ncbi:hypothetical protein P5673_023540 [Acropora cervicornis]|uniref:Ribosome biogenesis regulatory protein n=1 Tax=Acropora cervicornis TaxID=6130 RepID=A0AAD9Q5E2_ACRCE|nr:hypothetical protein P5673_023540 [Acropora cervicornis]
MATVCNILILMKKIFGRVFTLAGSLDLKSSGDNVAGICKSKILGGSEKLAFSLCQTDTEVDDVAVEANNAIEETKVDEVDPSQNPSVIEDLAKEIRRARTQWENTSITERPLLPKITVNRKAELLIKQANQAIQLEIAEETPDLNNINLLQYVTAYLKSEKLGKTPKPPKRRSNAKLQPKWKTRIENQIKGMRADLSILSDIAQKSEIQKISKKKQKIQNNNKPRSTNNKRIPQDGNSSKSPND